VGEPVFIHLRLLIGRHAIMPGLRFIQRNVQTLLFDQHMSFRNVDIDPLGVAIRTLYFLFEIYTFCDAFHAKDVRQDFYPIRAGVFIFSPFSVPPVKKLPCRLALLSICHDESPPILLQNQGGF